MAPKKKTETTDSSPKGPVLIRVKTPRDWSALIEKQRETHWRRLRVTIHVREWLLAGQPANLDAANAMLKARGLEDHIEAVADIEDPEMRAQAAERIATDEGLCEFARRPGESGVWLKANNVKAGVKENWSVLGLANSVRGSRKSIAEGIFVFAATTDDVPFADRDWIYLGERPDGVYTGVSHSIGPAGPRSSIKRHEYMVRPSIAFDMYVARYDAVDLKLSDDNIAKMLIHFGEHGLGACRSQGYGKFDLVEVRELEGAESIPATSAA